MGFFGLFKKKDDFDSMLKDPLTDPLGSPSNDFSQGNNNSFAPPQAELPPFDMPGMPNQNESGIDNFSQSMNPNYNTTAAALPQRNQNYANPPPLYRGPSNSSEAYEETINTNQNKDAKQGLQKKEEVSIDKRDIELLNAKLDNIKSQLENIGQRMNNMEREAYGEHTPKRRYAW